MDGHKRIVYCFWAIILAIFAFPQTMYAIYFNNIGVKEGLSQLSVMSMHQDVLGRMWFGTLEGLSIYDGRQMLTLKSGDEQFDTFIKGNEIKCITENAAHDIFFMADGALIEYKFFQSQINRIRERDVTSVSSINGKIYVSVKDSILLWDEGKRQLRPFLTINNGAQYIYSVYKDSAGIWWIASATGLYKWQGQKWQCIISGTHVWSICESRSQELWISTNNGLYKINQAGKMVCFKHDSSPHSISSNRVRRVVEDQNGNLWVGTFKGLNKYSPTEDKFDVFVEGNLPSGLQQSSIHSMMLDNQGNMWVGTYYAGAIMFTPDRQSYTYYPISKSGWGYQGSHLVGQMVEDSSHNLWICMDGDGLGFMERDSGRVHTFNTQHSSIRSDNLKSICYDAVAEKLYFALYENGISSYDIRSGKFENLMDKFSGDYSKNVLKIALWNNQLLYVSVDGVFRLDIQNSRVVPLMIGYGYSSFTISEDDILYVVGYKDIVRIDLRGETEMKRLKLRPGKNGSNLPLCISQSPNGNIYVGTMGGGIIECDSALNSCRRYTTKQNGLFDDYCYAIAVSKSGKLVLLGSKGISFFNIQTKTTECGIMVKHLPVTSFNDGNGLLVAENGDIFVGSTDGFLMLTEDAVLKEKNNLSLYYSGLFVNNAYVRPGDKSGILDRVISYTKEISLEHNQNNISLTFASNNFGHKLSTPFYEYKLEGFDDKWITVDEKGQLTYTNLNPGRYILRLREKSTHDDMVVQEAKLMIVIHPSFYNTPLAWLIYVLLTITIFYLILLVRRRQIMLKKKLENEKNERERTEEMDNFKFKFFTNISHELRTPLTLIITQAELLLHSRDISVAFRNKIDRLYQNACYMSNLINELLDFHKLEQKQMRLKASRGNIVPFLNHIFRSFEEKAIVQSIHYNFLAHNQEIFCWFDAGQLHKVFFNLLSNAFKYTKNGGMIEMTISEESEECVIRVIDSGVGIAKEDIQKIFDRFYQVSVERDIVGSGIGLALSKEIVTLHHGEMSVESMLGYGSIFTVRLKKGKEYLCNDPKIELVNATNEEGKYEESTLYVDTNNVLLQDQQEMEAIIQELRDASEDGTSYSILIVEDDPQLQAVLGEIFISLYHVLKASNGKEGWMLTQKERPDIVLSDVMMPEMDGLEMCRRIKNTEKTRHIPVVFLTAAGSTEQQMDGLRTGADDYLSKPFSTKLLLLKVAAILRSRVTLKNMLGKENVAGFDLPAKNEQDHLWLEQVGQIVQAHIDDYEFTVDKLADELKQSRSYVFKKIKELKGITPADFILGVRLKKGAALLLSNPKMQVEEVAEQVGFGSGRYFSKVFKEYFNLSPSQYRKMYGANC